MKRIASGSQVASAPTYAAGVGTPGHFADAGSTPAAAPTELTPEWCEGVQEAVCQTIEGSGAALSSSSSQFAETMVGVHGIKSHATSAGPSTPNKRVVIASNAGVSAGAQSAAIAASGTSTAGGTNSLVAACTGALASGTQSAAVGCDSSTASGNVSAVVGCSDGTASADDSAVLGGLSCTVSGARSVALGGDDNSVTGTDCAAIGGADNVVGGANSAAMASTGTTIAGGGRAAAVGCRNSYVGGPHMVLVGSFNAALFDDKTTGSADGAIGGGYNGTPLGGTPTANTQLTWTIGSTTGDVNTTGTVTGSSPNTDFAEVFANASKGVLPDGCLVTLRAGCAAVAAPGDRVHGVVSAAPGVLLGAGSLGWSGQYEADEFGRVAWETVEMVAFDGFAGDVRCCELPIPDGAERWTVRLRKRSAGYDPSRPYTPRTARPEEHTAVALVGQVRVRVGKGVTEGDLLAPGAGGVAVAAKAPKGRPVEVLTITSPYDAARGYAVAHCLVG